MQFQASLPTDGAILARSAPLARINAAILLFFACPIAIWAQSIGAPPSFAQIGNSHPNELFISPFRYIAPKTAAPTTTPEGNEAARRPPKEQRIVELSDTGDYVTAGSEGLALIASEKPDDSLQLIIANSLAWSGRLKEATTTYQGITQEPLVDDANVGIANILRWKGRDEVAAPMYRDVLAKSPEHIDARNGLELAERELAPRTTIMFGRSSDSSESVRGAVSVGHRWRDNSGYKVYEIETGAVRDELPGMEARQQDVTVRYSDLSVDLKPTLELSAPINSSQTVFGGLKFWISDESIQFDIGRVNWAKTATNPNALVADLSATHLGVLAKRDYSFGLASARADYFNVSDSNTLVTSDVKLISSLRPLGNAIKPYAGIETRKASMSSGNYWSPTNGYGSLYGGLSGDWLLNDWSLFGSAQVGLALYGDAGTSWSVSGGMRRWLADNFALSVLLWGMRSERSGAEYRAQSANVLLEKVWR